MTHMIPSAPPPVAISEETTLEEASAVLWNRLEPFKGCHATPSTIRAVAGVVEAFLIELSAVLPPKEGTRYASTIYVDTDGAFRVNLFNARI